MICCFLFAAAVVRRGGFFRGKAMQPREFAEFHLEALEANEARHNVLLAILDAIIDGSLPGFRIWTLGASGQCAAQTAQRAIVLGELDARQCRALAEATETLDYPGVVGPDLTAQWFVDRAAGLGIAFHEPMPQQIHALQDKPCYPGVAGTARLVDVGELSLFTDWMVAFTREATPHDPLPERERLAKVAAAGRYMFWVVDGEPVSMAGIVRRTRNGAAIAGVYTPPPLRGRGYAGSVVSAVVELAFAQGKTMTCLYTDLRNSFSNRCYAKIGFTPVCSSLFYSRALAGEETIR
jgi:GNAT superfamily N-acetyltransferase